MHSLPSWVTWEWVDGLLTASGTAALALYGAVQIREARRERLQRRVLARRERRDRQTAALATLRGEFVRLSRLNARWQDADLELLIAADAISESDLIAPDWRGVTVGIGVLGGKTSLLAAIAYGVLADAALLIRTAKADVKLRAQAESNSAKASGAETILPSGPLFRSPGYSGHLIADIRQWLSDSADLLQEAIWQAPGGRQPIPLDEMGLITEGGKRLLTQLKQPRATSPRTSPGGAG